MYNNFSIKLGNELILNAEESDYGYSWGNVASPNQNNLTGFSHGTAGIAFALMELFRNNNEIQYFQAAEKAFNYERFWFNKELGNWPDFRKAYHNSPAIQNNSSYSTFWCHGAPGIALSRLRAYKILHEAEHKYEAITALETTQKMINTSLKSGTGNFSLCHGLAGNADILLYGSNILSKKGSKWLSTARDVADFGLQFFGHPERNWPLGMGNGKEETPNLMLGLAGIGYFYLRLYDQSIPSILILEPESFVQYKK